MHVSARAKRGLGKENKACPIVRLLYSVWGACLFRSHKMKLTPCTKNLATLRKATVWVSLARGTGAYQYTESEPNQDANNGGALSASAALYPVLVCVPHLERFGDLLPFL